MATDPHDYDIDKETAASRNMLENRIAAELNRIKLALIDIDKRKAYEPWRLALTFDLVDAIERNVQQLLETMTKTGSQPPAGSPAISWSCSSRSNTAGCHARTSGAFTKMLCATRRG